MTNEQVIKRINEIREILADYRELTSYDHEALDIAISALSKQCASSEQADKKLFGHGYWIMPGEVFISHNVLNEVLDTIIKSTNTEPKQPQNGSICTKTAENDEDRTTNDQITDSDKMVDQFRDSAKKTDDVPDTNVGKTDFKPGDKFILELGQERRMFDEFEISGTDLYVETRLLEKLTRYEPEEKTEKIPYKKPEIIKYERHYDHTDCIWYRYLGEEEPNECPSTCSQYRDGWNDAMDYIFCNGKGYQPYERKAK